MDASRADSRRADATGCKAPASSLTIAVTGASGLLGRAACDILKTRGHQVIRLVRHNAAAVDEVQWDPLQGLVDRDRLTKADVLLNLAGANIAAARWTAARKQELLESRVKSAQLIAATALSLRPRLKLLISMSGAGYYGDRGAERLEETAAAGQGFLAELCQKWEAALALAQAAGLRTVILRTGVVLTSRGGALVKMLLPFRLGLGGVLDSGRQFMSWISLEDWLEILLFAVNTGDLDGPVNAVAPAAVTNRDFTKTLNQLLKRPGFLPLPTPLIRLLYGEMGQQTLLASQNIVPAVLIQRGFHWKQPDIRSALSFELGLNS